MNELHILKKAIWTEPPETGAEAFEALKSGFPKRVVRRMTRLGMQLSRVLGELELDEACGLVYATSYSEACTIEKYLASFPYPSPQAFQTSIHPGGVEQFLIHNKQPVTEFFPLAGGDDLLLRALDTARLCAGETVVLCGGEERGSWLRDVGLSSETNYAWALKVRRGSDEGSIGRIAWRGLAEAKGTATLMTDFVQALQRQRPYHYNAAGGGELELSWRV